MFYYIEHDSNKPSAYTEPVDTILLWKYEKIDWSTDDLFWEGRNRFRAIYSRGEQHWNVPLLF